MNGSLLLSLYCGNLQNMNYLNACVVSDVTFEYRLIFDGSIYIK